MQNLLLNQTLKDVSRSFYFSICLLPKSINETVGLAYLVCRAADSISDTPLLPYEKRLAMLREFEMVMTSFPLDTKEANQFSEKLLKEMLAHEGPEALLLKRLPVIAREVAGLSRTSQALIQKVVQGVIRGMLTDLNYFSDNPANLKAFDNQEELDSYLLYIGGQPGLFWSNVWMEQEKSLPLGDRSQWILQGIDLGKGLQMINILRDIPRDLKNGRCYIPSSRLIEVGLKPSDLLTTTATSTFLPLYHQMIDESLTLLEKGMAYIDSVPRLCWRLRLSAWLPIAIGLETLIRLRESEWILDEKTVIKIPRSTLYKILISAFIIIHSKTLLRATFRLKMDNASAKMA